MVASNEANALTDTLDLTPDLKLIEIKNSVNLMEVDDGGR